MTDKEEIIINCSNGNFKRYILNLQHERDELRKYLIDIYKLLGIDVRQSLSGANYLEFYAVLSSTAENKIKELKEQLKHKERALDEIEKIVSADYYDDSWGTLAIKIDSIKEIINKAKET